MGNAAIIYDSGRISVDLGANGVTNAAPGRAWEGARHYAGAAQIVTTRRYDVLKIEKVWAESAHPGLYRQLSTFWNDWAIAGNPFAFVLDTAKANLSPLVYNPGFGNWLPNGGFEAWLGSFPDGWSFAQTGGTTLTKETLLDSVAEGLYALKFTQVAGAQSNAYIRTTDYFNQNSYFNVSLRHKNDAKGTMAWAVRNTVDNTWWTGATWSGTQTVNNVTAPTSRGWTLYTSPTIQMTGNASPLEVYVRNATTGNTWVDDVRLTQPYAPNQAGSAGKCLLVAEYGTFAIGDVVRVRSKAGGYEEWAQLADVYTRPTESWQDLYLTGNLRNRYVPGDTVQNVEHYPFLVADQDDPALQEEPGSIYKLEIKCREALPGRT